MNVPKLRFKEFNDEYNLISFGDLVDYQKGFAFKSKDYKNNGIRIIRISDTTANSINNLDGIYIDAQEKGKYMNVELKTNDIIISSVGSKPPLYDSMVGKVVLVPEHANGSLLNQNAIRFRSKRANQIYLYNYLKQNKYTSFIESIMRGNANQRSITLEDLFKFELYVPNINEQNKVAKTLELLDRKIELQSKKIEDLKLFKKGLIHQMKKSNNNWSEYKISEIFKITRGVVIPKTDLLDNKTTEYQYPVYSSQTSNNGILGYDTKFDFDGKYLTWTTDGANAGKVFYRNGKFRCTNVCGVLYNDNNKYVDELTAELLNYETPKHVSYVGNPKLMNNVMGDIKIFLPDSNESDRVSNILLIINNKVLLETDKLNKLNKLKKGLMQKMFV